VPTITANVRLRKVDGFYTGLYGFLPFPGFISVSGETVIIHPLSLRDKELMDFRVFLRRIFWYQSSAVDRRSTF
jgi:hypothetical protein